MAWFRRLKERLFPAEAEKRDVPEGIWHRCPSCKAIVAQTELEENLYVCPHCDYHFRMTPRQYFALLFDNQEWEERFEELRSIDFLEFRDRKTYHSRLKQMLEKTDVTEAIVIGVGKIEGRPLVVAAMDFRFIGGSMGSVVGERFTRAVEYAIAERIPLLSITQSGGARMMESAFSLMQMAKTAAILTQMEVHRLPYWVLLTDPTTGGVTASFGMLGDVMLAEPGALIGFAGPRVIRETIKRDLPPGFQRSEFQLEHGFVDRIVHRRELRATIVQLYRLFMEGRRYEGG